MTAEKTQKQCLMSQSGSVPVPHALCEMFWTLGPAFSRWTESRLHLQGRTPQRMRLMAFLWKNGPVKMNALRNELGVTATSVTALVDSLQKEGMVTRKADKADRRATLVKLTPAAEKQLKSMCGPFKDEVSAIFSGLSAGEQKTFLRLLGRMRDALVERDILKKPVA
ncbi:MAG: winged helix-turn-helix transcriptional regulator [Alphaproteobacteria bacterium]|nr:MarR family winged helix-turn-helix transcriptional regulator [Alphaproteobacteria bacterium]MDE2336447.1 winged helix-turn-helix transcriptional regulator [Alphaproteobacteria bacterium]